ncbi:unnamed protein product [Absidia cylindrospora]
MSSELQSLPIDEYFKITNPGEWSFDGFKQFRDNGNGKPSALKAKYRNSLQCILLRKGPSPSLKRLVGILYNKVLGNNTSEQDKGKQTIKIHHSGQGNIKFINELQQHRHPQPLQQPQSQQSSHQQQQQSPQQQSPQQQSPQQQSPPQKHSPRSQPQQQIPAEQSEHRNKRQKVDTTDNRTIASTATDTDAGAIEQHLDNENPLNIVDILTDFLQRADNNGLHEYRLEDHGVFQIGVSIPRQQDVPDILYDHLPLDDQPPNFPIGLFSDYLGSTLYANEFGTPTIATDIFSKTHVAGRNHEQTFFIMRMLFIISENIHCRVHEPKLSDSEASYCAFALWPLLNTACNSLPRDNVVVCDFRVGETLLDAMDTFSSLSVKTADHYLADGKIYLKNNGLELLLLEASGPFGKKNVPKHVSDHIKGAYGCYAMLMAILDKYKYADKHLMEDLRVLFVHAGSNGRSGTYLRLWVMKPCMGGNTLSFERLAKARLTTDAGDNNTVLELIHFFWKVKGMMERCVQSIAILKESNDANCRKFMTLNGPKPPVLTALLKPKPVKPSRPPLKNIATLDPVSMLT